MPTWGWFDAAECGDIAIINNNVTVTTNTTIGDGSNSTVLSVTNGTLTVIGGDPHDPGAIHVRQVEWKRSHQAHGGDSGTTPAGIVLDGNAGVSPVISTDNDTIISITGTPSARCFIETLAGTAGNPGYITNCGYLDTGYMVAAYTDFSRLGNALTPGIYAPAIAALASGQPIFSFDHCTIDSCGTTPYLVITTGTAIVSLTNSVWTNPVASDWGDEPMPTVLRSRRERGWLTIVNSLVRRRQHGPDHKISRSRTATLMTLCMEARSDNGRSSTAISSGNRV